MKNLIQPFHLVTLSPWPILLSLMVMNFFISLLYWFNFLSFSLSIYVYMLFYF